MFCEAAQIDCKYLDVVKEVEKNCILLKAVADDRETLLQATEVGAVIDTYLGEAVQICEENLCGVIARTITNSIIDTGFKNAEEIHGSSKLKRNKG